MTRGKLLKWFGFGSLLFICAVSGARSIPQPTSHLYTWDGKYVFTDASSIGSYWTCLWLGYGTGRVDAGQLLLRPMASTSNSETHSALVRSNFPLGQAWDISANMCTDVQLRTAKTRRKPVPSPNPWEVAWLIADMADDGSAGLYFIFKTNGVELGAYRYFGNERVYLYTSGNPSMRLGRSYAYRLFSDGSTLTAVIDGVVVAQASLSPLSAWQLGDKIGLYTEDAAVRFGPVSVQTEP